jgi:hypothetical protein
MASIDRTDRARRDGAAHQAWRACCATSINPYQSDEVLGAISGVRKGIVEKP